jgi:hypothetical protein
MTDRMSEIRASLANVAYSGRYYPGDVEADMDYLLDRVEALERELDENDGMDYLLNRWLHLYPASIAGAAVEPVRDAIREASTAMAKLRITLDEYRATKRRALTTEQS